MTATTAERFARKVQTDTETGCHVWTGGIQSSGYGAFKFGEHMGLAHRYAWEVERGPIPDELEIDHLCRNKRCVNVAHLEVVTRSENLGQRRRPPVSLRGPRPLLRHLEAGALTAMSPDTVLRRAT